MTLAGVDSDPIAARLALIRPHLDERAWRLLLGAEARVLGAGGIKTVAAAGGAHPDTVAQGVRELDYDEPIPGRVRRPGAGRPPKAVTDPELVAGAGCAGGSGLARGSGVAVAVDDEIDREAGRRADRRRASGVRADGGQAAQTDPGTACRRTRKPLKATSIRIGMRSSVISTPRSRGSRGPGTR